VDLEFTHHCTSFRSPSLKAKTELVEALAAYRKARPKSGQSVEKLTSMLGVLSVVAENGGIIQEELRSLVRDLEAFLFCDRRTLTADFQSRVCDNYPGTAYIDAVSDIADRVPYFYLHLTALDLIKEQADCNVFLTREGHLKVESNDHLEMTCQLHKLNGQLDRCRAVVSDLESQVVFHRQKAAAKKLEARAT
jgi:hypothetical protein